MNNTEGSLEKPAEPAEEKKDDGERTSILTRRERPRKDSP